MKRATFSVVLPLLFVTLAASEASAAEREAAKAPAPSDAHLRGVELVVRPTIGGAGASSPITAEGGGGDVPAVFRSGTKPFGLAAGVGMQVGFRFRPFVSAGLRLDLGRVTGDDPGDGARDLGRDTMGAGLYTRIYPLAMNESLRKRFDPWIGLGAGYARDVVSFAQATQTSRGTTDVKWQADRHAIAIPIGIGFDVRATDWLSVGPSLEYAITNPIVGCVKASAGGAEERVCSDDASGRGLVVASSGARNAGLTLRVTPF